MAIKQLFEQFVGASGKQGGLSDLFNGHSSKKQSMSGGFPGGAAGGMAAGGIVALLMGNKKARKYAGKAATVGGVALLGGAAYQFYQNYQKNQQATPAGNGSAMPEADAGYQLTLIKAMIAAAKADGHIDDNEQCRIFESIENASLSDSDKALIIDLLEQPISVTEFAKGRLSEEQKAEVYYVSCIVGEIDHPRERQHLDRLAIVLNISDELKSQIERQASVVWME